MRKGFLDKDILRRLEIIEEAIGQKRLEEAEEMLNYSHEDACANDKHTWTQIAYDLQGGKWGKDKCIHCGEERGWSV